MNNYKGTYLGNLRCRIKHIESGSIINTDAPKDNHGKGETYSPTDLLATALGSCMVTIIAIRANAKKINLGAVDFDIEKVMQSCPRKVSEIKLTIKMNKTLSSTEREYLEKEGLNCPVALSLHPELKQQVSFEYI